MSRFIAITLREHELPDRNEKRDCLEIGWWSLLASCGLTPICLPNHIGHAQSLLQCTSISGLILTGGGDVARSTEQFTARDSVETMALECMIRANLPVLGVCRGMQKLCLSFSGKLEPSVDHTGTLHRVSGQGIDRLVNSFHDNQISKAPRSFHTCASATDGSVEWMQHKKLPITGIMWHPERVEVPHSDDLELIQTLFSSSRD